MLCDLNQCNTAAIVFCENADSGRGYFIGSVYGTFFIITANGMCFAFISIPTARPFSISFISVVSRAYGGLKMKIILG